MVLIFMESIGRILRKDYLLLQESDLSDPRLSDQLQHHTEYLRLCQFVEFRILIPHNTSKETLITLNRFIEQQSIPGALRYYIPVNNQAQFDKEVLLNPELSFKEWVAILPTEDFRYENFAKKIWNLSTGGKAIMILLPERVKQWRSNTTYFKRLFHKGASLAFSGSHEYKLGFLHKMNVRQLHRDKIIHLWLTPGIYDIHSKSFQKDMDVRLDAITNSKTDPNDL